MKRKIDRDDPALHTRDSTVAGTDSNEFDDDITTSVSEKKADAANDDREEGDLIDDSGEVPDGSAPLEMTDDDVLTPGFLLKDRFRIVELVHSGGMGHVYKALDERRQHIGSDQIHVAIKMMRRSVATELDANLALEREAAKTQRLSHPNIVNIFDFDRHDEQFFLVMEWLEGESVNALLRRTSGRRLAPQFAWQVIQGIASGVQHAHSNNVVHADINPSNIFITDTQEIKLLDFGVARYGDDPENTADNKHAWATRRYASPEVLSGSTPTFEDDIFSLACVAYRLLSGTHPFAGLPSIEAKQAGVTVEPIPGLSETHWQTMSRALSYVQSDRPNSASAFFGELPAANSSGIAGPVRGRRSVNWLLVPPVAVVALLAGVWWLSQSGFQNEPRAIPETTAADDRSNEVAAASSRPSELDRLLRSAAQAINEERYLTPEDNNARVLYRDVLALEPANSIALSGLRTISDVYVQQANAALRSGEPARAIAALAIAAETDPENPAIAIANELLIAQGNGRLANARLAAADGQPGLATQFLSQAERYAHVDVNAINDVRRQIAQIAQDRQFLDRLAVADEHISAGRLTAPDGDNAHALLIELHQDHATDSRLLASMERLAEQLLTAAALAAAANRFPVATELLDATDALGVLPTEAAAVRISMQRAMQEEETLAALIAAAESAPAESAAQSVLSSGESEEASPPEYEEETMAALIGAAESAPTESVTQSVLSSGESEEASPPEYAAGEPASLPDPGGDKSDPAAAAMADASTIVTDEPSKAQWVEFSDLTIEKYVAPKFPRRAIRRGLGGVVEVRFSVHTDGSTGAIEIVNTESSKIFHSSAQNAVKQWRFAPREDVVEARVKLRFDQPPL